MTAPSTVRCAIYTRKSSEEGLDQAFNSLQAQREACEAYVRSQVSEGWLALDERYDDGGYSGATMRRPALERLLTDLAAGRVDLVIVYKVDRLTRALADFAKIIEVFDQHGVSFVSVTQAFNTTNSMSRLTLNVLLSFAQFEREITSERIRDKVAASKAKGMWMGGGVPMGYDPPRGDDRSLIVNPEEAEIVRLIFARYLELQNAGKLAAWLECQGIRSKVFTSAGGRTRGGCFYSTGALRHLLRNRVYIGEIVHKGARYPGRHQPIVDRETFDAVGALWNGVSRAQRNRITKARQTLLNGLLFDTDGQPMVPAFSRGKAGRHYQYYASPRAQGDRPGHTDAIRRVPCHVVDETVRKRVAQLLWGQANSIWPDELRSVVQRVEIHPQAVHIVIRSAALPDGPAPNLALKLAQARLQTGERVLPEPADPNCLRVILGLRLVERGGRQWVVGPDGLPSPARSIPNPSLVRRLKAAHRLLATCGISPIATTLPRYWKSPGSAERHKLAAMALIAPDLQRAILTGQVQAIDPTAVPLWWDDQRAALLGEPSRI